MELMVLVQGKDSGGELGRIRRRNSWVSVGKTDQTWLMMGWLKDFQVQR